FAIIAAIFVVTAVRVASTHRVFAPTVDEPTHIAAGRMWWAGVPAWEAVNPPLSRILFAIPYLNESPEGSEERGFFPIVMMYHRLDPIRGLAHARMFNLLFLGMGIFAVAA